MNKKPYLWWTELFEIELFIRIKLDLGLDKLQWLICHKTKPNQIIHKQCTHPRTHAPHIYIYIYIYILVVLRGSQLILDDQRNSQSHLNSLIPTFIKAWIVQTGPETYLLFLWYLKNHRSHAEKLIWWRHISGWFLFWLTEYLHCITEGRSLLTASGTVVI